MASPRQRRRKPPTGPATLDARAGLIVGAFRIEAELEATGGGRSFLARPANGEGEAILRFAPEAVAADVAAARRFLDFARRRALLAHPCLERTLAAGELAGWPWVAVERIDGGSLADELAEGRRLAAPRAVDLFLDAAHALAALHRAGFVHGSISATSLRLDRRDRVSLALADLPATDPATPASDLAALGATFYELLAGARPQLDAAGEPMALRARDPRVPRDLAAVVERALGWSPRGPYPDAAALAADLAPVAARLAPRPTPRALAARRAPVAPAKPIGGASDPESAQRFAARLAALAAVVLVGMILLVASQPSPSVLPPSPAATPRAVDEGPLRPRLLPRLALAGPGSAEGGEVAPESDNGTEPDAEAEPVDPGVATIRSLDRLLAKVLDYTATYGSPPPSLETLVVSGEASAEELTDGWQRPITYRLDAGKVTIESSGPDGIAGTPDDLAVDRPIAIRPVLPNRLF